MRRTPKKPSKLSESLHCQLNLYSVGATAAGVGILALAPAAEAKIVYTPAHNTIKLHEHYNLDLNHDGTTDYAFLLTSFHTRNTSAFSTLKILPKKVNTVEGGTHGTSCGGGRDAGPYAFAMERGRLIGSIKSFHDNANLMGIAGTIDGFSVYCGPWLGAQDRYLGLKFRIQGVAHFGWARLTVTSTHSAISSATLTGYAYETTPNKPIIAGKTKGPDVVTVEPGSLGALAAGRSGRK